MALFRYDSPGALTLDEAVERHMVFLEKERQRIAREQEVKAQAKARKAAHAKADAEAAAARGEPPPQAEDDFMFPEGGILGGFNPYRARMAAEAEELARQGRGHDTEIAHVAEGELVLPAILQNPEVMAAVRRAAAAQNIPLGRLRVGSARNSINPNTGAPEFGFWGDMKDWVKELPGQMKNAVSTAQGYVARPFESERSAYAIVLPPDGAYMPPPTAPEDRSFGYSPNGPSKWDLFKSDPIGAAQALWHQGRAWQEARDIYEGGPAAVSLYGGEGDAWKHARWNQRMVNSIGPERAKTFADAHERVPGNQMGDRAMDLYNNQVGRTLEGDTSKFAVDQLIRSGRLRMRPY